MIWSLQLAGTGLGSDHFLNLGFGSGSEVINSYFNIRVWSIFIMIILFLIGLFDLRAYSALRWASLAGLRPFWSASMSAASRLVACCALGRRPWAYGPGQVTAGFSLHFPGAKRRSLRLFSKPLRGLPYIRQAAEQPAGALQGALRAPCLLRTGLGPLKGP